MNEDDVEGEILRWSATTRRLEMIGKVTVKEFLPQVGEECLVTILSLNDDPNDAPAMYKDVRCRLSYINVVGGKVNEYVVTLLEDVPVAKCGWYKGDSYRANLWQLSPIPLAERSTVTHE